ncbi:hypothetical protein C6497_12980 [Candidatus Poribacteria bacterium]|nr:MAG: hypothetical protein C6497_12980 [Candidatus Poribacteria bacterium]
MRPLVIILLFPLLLSCTAGPDIPIADDDKVTMDKLTIDIENGEVDKYINETIAIDAIVKNKTEHSRTDCPDCVLLQLYTYTPNVNLFALTSPGVTAINKTHTFTLFIEKITLSPNTKQPTYDIYSVVMALNDYK